MINKKHIKYCPLSKFENGLCSRRDNIVGACTFGNGTRQGTAHWETCATPSRQDIVKDKFDDACDWLAKAYEESPYSMDEVTDGMKKLLREFVERCR